MTDFRPSNVRVIGGDAFISEAPLNIPSNSVSGTPVGVLASTLGPLATRTLLDNAGGRFAVGSNSSIVAGDTPTNWSDAILHTIKVQDVHPDGRILAGLVTIAVNKLTVALSALTLSHTTCIAGAYDEFVLATINGTYTNPAFTPSILTLCSDGAGTPYAGGKVQIDPITRELQATATPIGVGETVSFFVKEDMGGTVRFTPLSITGVAAVAPSAPTFTGNNGVIEYSPPVITTVAQAQATSSNPRDVLSWSVPDGKIDIDPDSGRIYVKKRIAKADGATVSALVTVKNAVGQTASATITATVKDFGYEILNSAIHQTTVVGTFEADSPTKTLDGSNNIMSLTGSDGTVWTPVQTVGFPYLASDNGSPSAQLTGSVQMKSTKQALLDLFAGQTIRAFTILRVFENTYSGASLATEWGWAAGSTSLVSSRQQANNAGNSINFGSNTIAVPVDGKPHVNMLVNNKEPRFAGLYSWNDNPVLRPNNTVGGNFTISSALPPDAFVIGGRSGIANQTDGIQGKLKLMWIVAGALHPDQLDAFVEGVTARYGLTGTAWRPIIDIEADYAIDNNVEFPANEPLVWFDDTAGVVGNGLIPCLGLNQSTPTGGAQTIGLEIGWYLNDRNTITRKIARSMRKIGAKLRMLAAPMPAAMKPYIGTNSGLNGAQPPEYYTWNSSALVSTLQYKYVFGARETMWRYTPGFGIWTGDWTYDATGPGSGAILELDFNENFAVEPANQPVRYITSGHFSNAAGFNQPATATTNWVPDTTFQTGIPILLASIRDENGFKLLVNRKEVRFYPDPGDMAKPMYNLMDITVSRKTSFTEAPNADTPRPAWLDLYFLRNYKKKLAAPTIGSGSHAKTTAFANAVTAAGGSVSTAERNALNTLFNKLEAYKRDRKFPTKSMLDRWQSAFCAAFTDPKAQLMDMIRLQPATIVGTGSLVPGAYWQGDGTTGYIETGYDFADAYNVLAGADASNAVGFNAAMAANIMSPVSQRVDVFLAGSCGSAAAKRFLAGTLYAGLNLDPDAKRVENLTAGLVKGVSGLKRGIATPTAFPSGLLSMVRYYMPGHPPRQPVHCFHNGTWYGMYAQGGGTLDSGTLTFSSGKTHKIGAVALASSIGFGDAKIGLCAIGPQFSDEDEEAYYPIINEFMHSLNPTLYP